MPMKLSDFKVLTFDCYGTLIDWESGISAALAPLRRAANLTLERDALLARFAAHEAALEAETPAMRYSELLAEVHRRLAREFGATLDDAAHVAFGASVPQWPAFEDTPAALQYLKRYYRLVILSNVDRASFAGSNRRLGVSFDAICTAEDIGSYKPDPRNFRYLIGAVDKLGFKSAAILHTAESLYHDHAPAKAAGLATAWIYRRQGKEGFGATRPPKEMPAYDFRFTALGEMARAHEREVER